MAVLLRSGYGAEMARTIDDDIRSFLDFWKTHEGERMEIADGVIQTVGCDDGAFGGCCSDHFDMSVIVDALEELAAPTKPRGSL
jgi:hypothetical protein